GHLPSGGAGANGRKMNSPPGPALEPKSFVPELANHLEPAFHGGQGTIDLLTDLLVGVAFHLPHRDGTQLLVRQAVEQTPTLLGHGHGKLGSRLMAEDLLDARLRAAGQAEEPGRFSGKLAAAVLQALLALDQVDGLAGGDDHQQAPEVVAVGEPGEAALPDALKETVEGALHHVAFIHRATPGAAQSFPRQANQPLVVALPEFLGGSAVSPLEPDDPVRNRSQG